MTKHRRNPYRFVGRIGNTLWWEQERPRTEGDSLVEQVSCDARWFYSTMLP